MRRDAFSRRMMRETTLTADDFIYPVFVLDGSGRDEPVESLPGVSRKSFDKLAHDAEACVALGVPAIALFPVIPSNLKSADASQAWRADDLVPRTVPWASSPTSRSTRTRATGRTASSTRRAT